MTDVSQLKIRVIAKDCIGDGACCDEAPGTFRLNADGIVEVLPKVTDDLETILNAAKNCPTDAIVVVDGESGVQLVP